MGVDLNKLLLTARLLTIEVSHVFLRLGADLGAATADIISAQHVLHRWPEEGGQRGTQDGLRLLVFRVLKVLCDLVCHRI